MIELDDNLAAELVPLSWLIGVWEGTGVVNYDVGDEVRNHEFGHRVSFSHDGLPHLNYTSYTWLIDPEADAAETDIRFLATETGYWRLSRPATSSDPGPGLLPG
ncbi:MAG: FABP family protein, partial [Burkholderiaceae bacterium]|nr:FABP family protein [Microbacteriaceae bacterium]